MEKLIAFPKWSASYFSLLKDIHVGVDFLDSDRTLWPKWFLLPYRLLSISRNG